MAEPKNGPEKAGRAAWLAVSAGIIGAFMASLDITMVNSSLPTIQGEIGASASEGTWISTAYLVAEIIMIPLTGWFSNILGLRGLLLFCTAAFTVCSVSCGLSHGLVEMVLGRLGQGFSGGAMIPTALSIVATRLPPAQRSIGTALFGCTAVLGPVLGPLLGGWLTENISWRYAFFINVPVGIGLVILLLVGLPGRAQKWFLFRQADLPGIIGLALGLGALTIVLEEGQRDRWLESALIDWLCVVSALGFALLALGQVISRKPVIVLRILFQRAFGSVFVLSLVVGAALYGVNYLLPQILSNLAGYNAEQCGMVSFVSGIPTFALMAFFPLLVRTVDVRITIGFGLFVYGMGCLVNTGLTTYASGVTFVVSQLLSGVGVFFTLFFLNQAATSAVPEKFAEDASGLFNAGRNLGGSFGLAAISTLREQRTTFHQESLAETITRNSVRAQDYLRASAAQLGLGDPLTGMHRAYATLSQSLQRAAVALAFSDIYFVLGVILVMAVPLALLLKPLANDKPASNG